MLHLICKCLLGEVLVQTFSKRCNHFDVAQPNSLSTSSIFCKFEDAFGRLDDRLSAVPFTKAISCVLTNKTFQRHVAVYSPYLKSKKRLQRDYTVPRLSA